MAIRQSDERFLMTKVWPAMAEAERYLRGQDALEAVRHGEELEYSALTQQVLDALDELALRIKRQGGLSGWKVVNERVIVIQESRCAHKGWFASGTQKERSDGSVFIIMTCHRCYKKKEHDIPQQQEVAS